MFTLFHHPFCPHSRFVRLALGEYGLDLRLVDERAWERRDAFLALNPAGTTPVLISEGRPAIPGAGIIAEYLDETHGAAMKQRRLLPSSMGERIEVRRLMAWFNEKFFEEVSHPLVTERIYKRFMSEGDGGGAPATDVIRARSDSIASVSPIRMRSQMPRSISAASSTPARMATWTGSRLTRNAAPIRACCGRAYIR